MLKTTFKNSGFCNFYSLSKVISFPCLNYVAQHTLNYMETVYISILIFYSARYYFIKKQLKKMSRSKVSKVFFFIKKGIKDLS